jgi:hypothetical protein
MQAAHRVRVEEADNIALRFFAREDPAGIRLDARDFSNAVAHQSRAPLAPAMIADQDPAFLDAH